MSNRLARESSPYLLQHAHNPVDWYPWGEEAFAAARQRNCPIFLSVGYSTCYWCHVMERECFENAAIAQLMNELFINIKVDREERPDVDQLYMTAVQVLTRRGGWPMNVFLTPDLRPFYGGTYFPPQDAPGRMGFPGVLQAIAAAWKDRPQEVERAASELLDTLTAYGTPPAAEQELRLNAAYIDDIVGRSLAGYDQRHGGFGGPPKFPQETLLDLLLHYCRVRGPGASAPADMLQHTLDAMARGGIHDQLGGGFHRYSTDAKWLVPHFEIMLYDNAMLAPIYAEAAKLWNRPFFAECARGICDFMLRKFTDPGGGFYTALDAEVDAREGEPYVWAPQQVADVLGPDDAALIGRVYGLDRGFNFADPHHGSGEPDRNVLYLAEPLESVAQRENLTAGELEQRLAPLRQALLDARERRKQPSLDNKILTGWNALAIAGLARAGAALEEPRYIDAAIRAAKYLLASHRRADGAVLRMRHSEHSMPGTLEDYAYLAMALLTLHRVTGDASWRDAAQSIMAAMHDRFGAGGGYYSTAAGQGDILVRQQVGVDSPLPSGNAAAALSWLQLGQKERAADVLRAFAFSLEQHGEAMSALVLAAVEWVDRFGEMTIAPAPQEAVMAHEAAASPATRAQDVVDAEIAATGDRALTIFIQVAEGWHLNAATESGGREPTRATALGDLAALVEQVIYPEAAPYAGDFTIELQLSASAPSGAEVVLSYQPCSENACLPTVRRVLRVP
jgi:uncharacterized protein YyaL (SSP411 family)